METIAPDGFLQMELLILKIFDFVSLQLVSGRVVKIGFTKDLQAL